MKSQSREAREPLLKRNLLKLRYPKTQVCLMDIGILLPCQFIRTYSTRDRLQLQLSQHQSTKTQQNSQFQSQYSMKLLENNPRNPLRAKFYESSLSILPRILSKRKRKRNRRKSRKRNRAVTRKQTV